MSGDWINVLEPYADADDYARLQRAIETKYRTEFTHWADAMTKEGLNPQSMEDLIFQASGSGVKPIKMNNGKVVGYSYYSPTQSTVTNPANSNATVVKRGTTEIPVSTTVNQQTGKAAVGGLSRAGNVAKTALGAVGTGVALASVGIWLGKTIDSALYNLNPDFWDNAGLSGLDPTTWGAITRDQEGIGADLFNIVFGIDPETGNTQAYIDENAAAYAARYMDLQGVFSKTRTYTLLDESLGNFTVNGEVNFCDLTCGDDKNYNGTVYKCGAYSVGIRSNPPTPWAQYVGTQTVESVKLCKCGSQGSTFEERILVASPSYNGLIGTGEGSISSSNLWFGNGANQVKSYTYDNKTVYYQLMGCFLYNRVGDTWNVEDSDPQNIGNAYNADWRTGSLAWLMVYGNKQKTSGVVGFDDQPNATFPDFTGAQTTQDYLDALQNQYPDTFANALPWSYIDEDGNEQVTNYIPIPLANINSFNDMQPTSATSTQANPQVNPDTATQEMIQTIVQTLTQSTTINGNANPTQTGVGDSPTSVIPVGSASSLWSVYHPTQSQVNAFGGWLWSSNFIDQLLKVFNNPMESIIGLHKVFATPVDAGTSTIHVGYLDSEVPSDYVTQQYVTVDCGSVDLNETFANVFDYSPFTSVQLYLPFVGIVPLDVADVMRSTISVKYDVDIFTGACLASVVVNRDYGEGVLYQYSGNCAAQYPLSSGSYMGIVAGIASIAGGAVATIASGGTAAPVLLGAAGAAMSSHTQVQHSGSFSGNAGAMGCKIPYLIISRPQTAMYDEAGEMEGLPANNSVRVGDCTGFVKAKAIRFINVSATDTELEMIESLLIDGIYV